MPIGQDEDIRIYELPEAQELTAGMKVAVDSENGGTKSFDLTTAMSEKVEEFVAEYNVTSYEDIDAAYKAGKSVICKYQPSPQGNPDRVYYLRSMQYIPYGPDTGGYMFGSVTAILGMEFLTCQKLNGSTVWYAYHNQALEQPSNAAANGKFLSNDGSDNVWVDPPEGVPSSTAEDEGKVLTVDSNGAAVWGQSGSTKEIYDIRGIVYSRYVEGGYYQGQMASIVIDKSYNEVLGAFNSGKDLRLTIRAKLLGANESISSSDVAPYFAEDNHIEQTLWFLRDYQTTIPGSPELGTAFAFVPKSIYDIVAVSGTSRIPLQPCTIFRDNYIASPFEFNVCSSDISVQIFTYNQVWLSYNSTYYRFGIFVSDPSDTGIDIPLSVTWAQFAKAFSDYSYDHNFPEIIRQWDAINVSELVFRICEVHMSESVETDRYLKFSCAENGGTSYITIFPKLVDGVLQTYWRYDRYSS